MTFEEEINKINNLFPYLGSFSRNIDHKGRLTITANIKRNFKERMDYLGIDRAALFGYNDGKTIQIWDYKPNELKSEEMFYIYIENGKNNRLSMPRKHTKGRTKFTVLGKKDHLEVLLENSST
ncbi:MAG: hypothetical protein AABW50_01255 [Nanoarchaeota archaeon]